MSGLWTGPLRRLAGALAELRERVRAAVAWETARLAGEAAREVVAAALTGGAADPTPRAPARRRAAGPGPDPWDDRPGWDDDEFDSTVRHARGRGESSEDDPRDPPGPAPATPAGVVPAAVAAGVTAARWWLRRRGAVLEAVAVGLTAAAAVLAGGPVARAGAAAAATAADLAAVADALGAARLGRL